MQRPPRGGLRRRGGALASRRRTHEGAAERRRCRPSSARREHSPARSTASTSRARRAVLDGLLAGATVDTLLTEVGAAAVTCTSSASAGSAARCRSRRSTSPRPSCGTAARPGPRLGPRLSRCSPASQGEQHDLGLIAFGLALRARGWRVAYLGERHAARDARRDRARRSIPRSSSCGRGRASACGPSRRAARPRPPPSPRPRRQRRRRAPAAELGAVVLTLTGDPVAGRRDASRRSFWSRRQPVLDGWRSIQRRHRRRVDRQRAARADRGARPVGANADEGAGSLGSPLLARGASARAAASSAPRERTAGWSSFFSRADGHSCFASDRRSSVGQDSIACRYRVGGGLPRTPRRAVRSASRRPSGEQPELRAP